MCRKMKRTIRAVICVITMSVFNVVPVFACTPKLNPPSVKIPDINFEPDDALKEAINNAAKNWIEKCILDTPTVEYASYYKSASRYWSDTAAWTWKYITDNAINDDVLWPEATNASGSGVGVGAGFSLRTCGVWCSCGLVLWFLERRW